MSLSATQRLKLEALLLPTPLYHVDPSGEEAREAEVRRVFGLEGPSPDRQRLENARTDAEGALDGMTPESTSDIHRAARLMDIVHPLDPSPRPALTSDDVEKRRKEWATWFSQWDNARNTTLNVFTERVQSPTDWLKLVREVRTTDCFTKLPNNPTLPDHSVAAHRVLTAALIGAREAGDAALLLVQVGPVQPFIDASRRTRDLWAGSYLMSLMSAKVVACLMKELGPEGLEKDPRGQPDVVACLMKELCPEAIITPQPESSALLQRIVYGDKDVTDSDALQPALPAKVMALVPLDRAEALGEACIKEVVRLWDDLWKCCKKRVNDHLGGRFPTWASRADTQRDAFLERSFTVQPWPRDAGAVWAYVDEVEHAAKVERPSTPELRPKRLRDSLGASYGNLSGALWAIHSAQRAAIVPPAREGDHRFKCRVCGHREALGPENKHEQEAFWRELSEQVGSFELKPTEQLCAVCLMKRLGVVDLVVDEVKAKGASLNDVETLKHEVRSYPSVPSLACAPFRYKMICALLEGEVKARAVIERWVNAIGLAIKALPNGAPQSVRSGLAEIQALVDRAKGRPDAELVRSVATIDGPWLDEDAYEPERAWTEQVGKRPNPEDTTFKDFSAALIEAGPLWRAVTNYFDAKPSHYVAALYLDGDQLSMWLNGSHKDTPTYGALVGPNVLEGLTETPRAVSPALQGELSARLSALAGGAVKKVVDAHFGRLVYCGGDDVVALLPAQHALQCADALAKLFQQPDLLGPKVTVSVGVHIQHQREALGRLIKGARKAEEESKDKGRARLTITLTPRSGDGLTLTLPWGAPDQRSVKLLCELAGVPYKSPEDKCPAAEQPPAKQTEQNKPWWEGDTNDSPLNLKLGHVLRSELATLGYQPDARHRKRRPDWRTLQPIIESRVLALANAVGPKNSKRRDALDLPLKLLEADQGNPDRLVKTLLLARFLAREAPRSSAENTPAPSPNGDT